MSTLTPVPIRVLIADGDPLVGRALGRLLQDTIEVEVVATASDAAAALVLAGQYQPAVAVIDARTAQLGGLAVMRHLRRLAPAPHIVVVSVYATFRDQALAAGACRFLLKDCSRVELVTAIRLAAQGHCQARGDDGPDRRVSGTAIITTVG